MPYHIFIKVLDEAGKAIAAYPLSLTVKNAPELGMLLIKAAEDMTGASGQLSINCITDNGPASLKPAMPGITSLTKRQLLLLPLVAMGLKTAEIAAKLFIAPSTVSGHRKKIYKKMGVSNAAQLSFKLHGFGPVK